MNKNTNSHTESEVKEIVKNRHKEYVKFNFQLHFWYLRLSNGISFEETDIGVTVKLIMGQCYNPMIFIYVRSMPFDVFFYCITCSEIGTMNIFSFHVFLFWQFIATIHFGGALGHSKRKNE